MPVMKRENWVWMPHGAHFICARDCKFHLATYVGGYIVSTVGEMVPDAPVRERFASSRGVTLEGQGDARLADYMRKVGYQEIGFGRKYETMVFRAVARDPGPETDCCPWRVSDFSEIEVRGYNDPVSATKGHYELCAEYAERDQN